jgi:hypothetical protein
MSEQIKGATAYIAGRISGNREYKKQFDAAERYLRRCGYEVILNPAKLPEEIDPGTAIRICLAMIDTADTVFFISGWQRSKGAQLEHAYCEYVGKQVEHLQYSTFCF